jgi:hypothetical protein
MLIILNLPADFLSPGSALVVMSETIKAVKVITNKFRLEKIILVLKITRSTK